MVELSRAENASILERCVEEVDGLLTDDCRTPRAEDLGQLKYLEAVWNETLRLYPPTGGTFARNATQSHSITAAGTKCST
jgi:cytochrome P450